MELSLKVGPPAAGGTCVARHEGRVVFVSGALPGETVRAVVTDPAPGAKFWRAETIDVQDPSDDRVPVRWPEAGPGGVGGAELAHVALGASRRLKADVIADQFSRLAHLDVAVPVQPVDGDDVRDGLGWRTRMQFGVTSDGRIGGTVERTHDVRPLTATPLAVPALTDLDLPRLRFPGAVRVEAAASSTGDRLVAVHVPPGRSVPAATVKALESLGAAVVHAETTRKSGRRRGRTKRTVVSGTDHVIERVGIAGVGEHDFRVSSGGFWQVHRAAPQLLAGKVRDAAAVCPGDRVFDLYSGAGLFSWGLAVAAGPTGAVVAVEGSDEASRDAVENRPGTGAEIDVRSGSVAGNIPGGKCDVVVLDPPRAGAGGRVVSCIVGNRPRTVVYVSCDPATLARDCRYFVESGYSIETVEAFDLFPLTAHVELVVTLRPAG